MVGRAAVTSVLLTARSSNHRLAAAHGPLRSELIRANTLDYSPYLHCPLQAAHGNETAGGEERRREVQAKGSALRWRHGLGEDTSVDTLPVGI